MDGIGGSCDEAVIRREPAQTLLPQMTMMLNVAVVDPGPKDQTSFICDTDEGQGSQFSCACYANMCGVVVKRVD